MSTQGGVGQDHVCAIIADSLMMKCMVAFCHEALLYTQALSVTIIIIYFTYQYRYEIKKK